MRGRTKQVMLERIHLESDGSWPGRQTRSDSWFEHCLRGFHPNGLSHQMKPCIFLCSGGQKKAFGSGMSFVSLTRHRSPRDKVSCLGQMILSVGLFFYYYLIGQPKTDKQKKIVLGFIFKITALSKYNSHTVHVIHFKVYNLMILIMSIFTVTTTINFRTLLSPQKETLFPLAVTFHFLPPQTPQGSH